MSEMVTGLLGIVLGVIIGAISIKLGFAVENRYAKEQTKFHLPTYTITMVVSAVLMSVAVLTGVYFILN